LIVRKESDGFDLTVKLREDQYKASEPGTPTYYHRTPEGLIQIWPPLAEGTEQVYLFVTMAPIDLCVPDWIKHRHYEAIRSGVLGSMYQIPGPNFKPELAARYERRFRAAMSAATQDALVSGTGSGQRAVTPLLVQGSQRIRGSFASDGRRW
jgi:hypothetical protein